MMKREKRIGKSMLWAALLTLCMSVTLLTACGNKGDDLVLYGEEGHNYTIIYGSQRAEWEDTAIVTLYEGLEELSGVTPEIYADIEIENSDKTKEILIGSTNRPESKRPEVGEKDCYWCVKFEGNKIIIDGSNKYMLSVAVNHFMENWSEGEDEGTVLVSASIEQEESFVDYYRENWLLNSIPAYQGDNNLSTALYDCGTYVKTFGSRDVVNNMMQSVTSTNTEELADYLAALKTNHYNEESHTTIEGNEFYRYTKDEQRIFINYYAKEEKALVILDEGKGVSVQDTSYTYEPKAGERSEFYMFGIKMDPNGMNLTAPENTSGYYNNGECLIIKCADNSVIIVDGGEASQMSGKDQERFFKLLHQITGTSENETINISAWYITHMHSDHVLGFCEVLNKNANRINLERVICNMPNPDKVYETSNLMFTSVTGAIRANFPQCEDVKVHTGDVLQLADVTLTVMFTHEDLVDSKGEFHSTDFNDTSTVIMVENTSGMRMLVTGDINVKSEAVMCKNFTAESLKSNILQQPHHDFNDNDVIYELADAQVMLFTQAKGGLTKNADMNRRFTLAKKWCTEWYCEGNETVGFAYENGKVKLIYRANDIYD